MWYHTRMDNNENKQEAKTEYEVAEEITNQIVSNLSPEDIDKLGIQMVNLFVSFSVMEKTTRDPDALAKIAYSIDILRVSIDHALGGRCFDIQFDEDEVKPDNETKTESEEEPEEENNEEETARYKERQRPVREIARKAVSVMPDVEVSNLATQLISLYIETSGMMHKTKDPMHAATFKFINKLLSVNIDIAMNGQSLCILDLRSKKGGKSNE